MKILLIPSAILISHDMRKKFGKIPTGLFPLGNETMIDKIYKQYKNCVDKIYLVVYCEKELLVEYIRFKNLPIEIIQLDKVLDLGYTIQYGIKKILENNTDIDCLYINFADSLLEEKISTLNTDYLYFSKGNIDEKWTYFKSDNGSIVEILDKNELENTRWNLNKFQDIFIGIFKITNVQRFLECFTKEHLLRKTIDSFYRALYLYNRNHPFYMLEANRWFDVGHNENYAKAKTKVDARAFNSIDIDEKRGILKKTSQNKEKLINEISWYLKLPNQLQYVLPRIYDYSLNFNNPYVKMEYYGYKTLHEVLLYGNISKEKWKNIFNELYFIISDMEKYKVYDKRENLLNALREIYINKTFSRLNQLKEQQTFAPFFSNPIIINNKKFLSLDEYMSILPELIENEVIQKFNNNFSIIHGDLCFANILIEDTYNFIRLIDPRGKFGAYDIYGDPQYELAKLLHTLEGKYDFIIEDMFFIKINGTNILYELKNISNDIIDIFFEVFKDRLSNIITIRLIEATLFLSMIPLHSDHVNRQFAMLATGIILLDRVIHNR